MRIAIIAVLFTIFGCRSANNDFNDSNVIHNTSLNQNVSGPSALVYKTKADYSNYVPVILSDDKTKIISYPHPNDIITDKGFQLPDKLNQNYLLDNRGISKNVAFLVLTYLEYSKLETVPNLTDLYNLILDKNPLLELCDCGNKDSFKEITSQLNKLIDSNKLRTNCIVIK